MQHCQKTGCGVWWQTRGFLAPRLSVDVGDSRVLSGGLLGLPATKGEQQGRAGLRAWAQGVGSGGGSCWSSSANAP